MLNIELSLGHLNVTNHCLLITTHKINLHFCSKFVLSSWSCRASSGIYRNIVITRCILSNDRAFSYTLSPLSLFCTLSPSAGVGLKKEHNRRVLFIKFTTCNQATCISILTVLGTPCFTRYITVSAHILIIHHSYPVYHTTIIMLLFLV